MNRSIVPILIAGIFLYSCTFDKEESMTFFNHTNVNSGSPIERETPDSIDSGSFSPDRYDVSSSMVADYLGIALPEKEVSGIEPFSKGEKTIAWIVDFNPGWAIVSADRRTRPILAKSETGNYRTDIDNNPSLKAWIANYWEELLYLKTSDKEVGKEYISLWDILSPYNEKEIKTKADETNIWVRITTGYSHTLLSHQFVDHLIATKWGLSSPWNCNVPYYYTQSPSNRCQVGCVAVATGQILYYMHYKDNVPNGLYETVNNSHVLEFGGQNLYFSRSDYNSNSGRWDLMATDSCSTLNFSYVGDLLGDIGNEVHMNYGTEASLAYDSYVPFALNNHGLSSSTLQTFSYNSVKSEIASGYPVYLRASSNQGGGHAFIGDSFEESQYLYTVNYEWHMYPTLNDIPSGLNYSFYLTDEDMQTYDPNMYEGKTTSSSSVLAYKYLYMNWGFDGYQDNVACSPTSTWLSQEFEGPSMITDIRPNN